MTIKHTPAPWKITKSEDTNLISVRDANGIKIAGVSPRTDDELNARLIAAAPELLEALKAVDLILYHYLDDVHPTMRKVRAAITQAEE